MKRKNIDALREIRLWIGQVLVPAALLVFTINPELKVKALAKYQEIKAKLTK